MTKEKVQEQVELALEIARAAWAKNVVNPKSSEEAAAERIAIAILAVKIFDVIRSLGIEP